jgi:hypothetical protein
MPCYPMSRFRASVALGALALTVSLGDCGGTGATDQNPLGASSNQPAVGPVPQLGTNTVRGVTVSSANLRKSGSNIAVLAGVTSTHPDRLVRISSNYTDPLTLRQPIAVLPGTTTAIDPTTAVLRPSGPIDDGATVAVSFTFATAGVVQVYATYRA